MDNVTHLGLDVQSLEIRCDVFAPALIPRRAGQRDKTDRVDARNLVLHRAGELTLIRVDVSIAAKNLRAAREAVEALERVASETSATLLEATAATARASFDLAEGQVDQTPAKGRRAWLLWQQLKLPYFGAFETSVRSTSNSSRPRSPSSCRVAKIDAAALTAHRL
jgi:hypothetical protein